MITIVFKILVIALAFGGAYASVRASSVLAQSPYVQYTTDGSNDPSCIIAIGQCEEWDNIFETCTVRVMVGSTVISSSYWGKKPSCGNLLTNTTSAVAATKVFPAGTVVILQ